MNSKEKERICTKSSFVSLFQHLTCCNVCLLSLSLFTHSSLSGKHPIYLSLSLVTFFVCCFFLIFTHITSHHFKCTFFLVSSISNHLTHSNWLLNSISFQHTKLIEVPSSVVIVSQLAIKKCARLS